jgi:hypothetical protein
MHGSRRSTVRVVSAVPLGGPVMHSLDIGVRVTLNVRTPPRWRGRPFLLVGCRAPTHRLSFVTQIAGAAGGRGGELKNAMSNTPMQRSARPPLHGDPQLLTRAP